MQDPAFPAVPLFRAFHLSIFVISSSGCSHKEICKCIRINIPLLVYKEVGMTRTGMVDGNKLIYWPISHDAA